MRASSETGIRGAVVPAERAREHMKNDTERLETGRQGSGHAGQGGGRRWLAGLLLGVAAIAACEGENLFSGEGQEFRPRVNNLSAPSAAFAGDTVYIRVDAYAARSINQVVVGMRGAVSRDTTIEITPPKQSVSQVLAIAIPRLLQDTLLTVQANVTDAIGATSRVREVTIVTFGPPAVTNVSSPQVVRAGDPVSVRVQAFGSRRIAQVELVATGAIQKDTTVTLPVPKNNITQDIVLQLPAAATDTLLTFSVAVRDEAGLSSTSVQRTVPLVIDPPTVTLTSPATANAGMWLDLSIRATATRRVQEVRVELRGAVVKDTVVQINPTLTDVTKNVSILLPANITTSNLRVQAIAVDRGGAVATSQIDQVLIPLGPPVVTDVEVPAMVRSGFIVDVRVRARADRPLARIEVRFRGAADSTKTFVVAPQRIEVIQDASILIPLAAPDTQLVVLATATDVTGAVSEIVSRSISVIVPPPDTSDSSSAAGAWQDDAATVSEDRESPLAWSEPGVKPENGYSFAVAEPALPARSRRRSTQRKTRR